MDKYSKAILSISLLLTASGVSGQKSTVEEDIKYCEVKVRQLSAESETMDRMGDNASERTQKHFSYRLNQANSCAADLTERTGKKYKVSKDWFGSGYTLKKP